MNEENIVRPIDYLRGSSSSGHGISFYGNFHRCAYRMFLEHPTADLTTGLPPATRSAGYYAGVGILFGKLLELYYGGEYESVVFEFAGESEPPEWQEACRLFRYYRAEFSADEFQTVGVEVPFKFEGLDAIRLFGVPKFTGRIDWIVKVTAAQSTEILLNRGLVVQEGTYLLDHKVRWKTSKALLIEPEHRMQFKAYMMAWNALHPEDPCLGVIGNICMAYVDNSKTQRFHSTLCPVPGVLEQRSVRAYMSLAESKRLVYGYPANPEECFRYENVPCSFHPSQGGPCDLVGQPKIEVI